MKWGAIEWADGSDAEMEKFQFVFHLALKHVRDNSSIENIIIAQHYGLKANRVQPVEIRSILEGDNKVLLLIDGHDQYRRGRNVDIDKAIIKERLRNCWMIISSRKTEQLEYIKGYMDAEAEIIGFNEKSVKNYITSLLGSEEMADALVHQAKESNLITGQGKHTEDWGILNVPILLNMLCVLFKGNLALPATLTGIMQAIVDRCIDREAIRVRGQKAVDSAKSVLYNLGKLAWQGLHNPAGRRLTFGKVR